jgi:hypothetical protein
MVGINNELDALFSKCISNVIAMYYYDIDSNITLQLKHYQNIKYEIDNEKQIGLHRYGLDDDIKSSTFRNNNCFLTTVEHRRLVQSYHIARISVPLFVQQSGFFRDGIFPKMGIGPEAEMVYRMVTTGNLNVLTHFRKIRGDGAEHIIEYEDVTPINWDNSDYVGLLDTYSSGDIRFLKYVVSFYAYKFGENICVSITDSVVIVTGDAYNKLLYSDSSVNPINVVNYTHPNNYDIIFDWEDYADNDIGNWSCLDDMHCYEPYYEDRDRDWEDCDETDWGDRYRHWENDDDDWGDDVDDDYQLNDDSFN